MEGQGEGDKSVEYKRAKMESLESQGQEKEENREVAKIVEEVPRARYAMEWEMTTPCRNGLVGPQSGQAAVDGGGFMQVGSKPKKKKKKKKKLW